MPVAIDVSREIQRVLPCQPLGQFGVAPLQRFDDLQVIDDGAGRAVALNNGCAADGAYVNEEVMGCIDDGL